MTASSERPDFRKPRAFKIDDPTVKVEVHDDGGFSEDGPVTSPRHVVAASPGRLGISDVQRGIRWGSLLFSAAISLAGLAAGVWFTRFVSVALARDDWVGWLATGLMALIALALIVIIGKELFGFRRLARLSRLRKMVGQLVDDPDLDRKKERQAVLMLGRHYRGRADMAWGLARLRDHANDVLEPGELLRLTDRELLAPLDAQARSVILKSGKRIATVTALSPILWLALVYVVVENLRMFRGIATLYGGRPGFLGAFRLGRLVVGHIIATGGIAMTDDLLGQFLGQDLLRRLSRRLGEGAFNGALTARLGVAAVEVTRPMPYLDSEPLRVREIFGELFRSLRNKNGDDVGEDDATPKRGVRPGG